MIDKAIVSVLSMVFLLILFFNIIGMMLSFIQKINFDQACRSTLFEMDLSGGLTDEKRQDLRTNLESSGYRNITIEAPAEVQYGEWISLKVEASIKTIGLINFIQKEEGMLYFSYDRKIISRKIHNMAY